MKKGKDYEMMPQGKGVKNGAVMSPQSTPIAKKRKANNAKANAAVGG